MEHLVLAVEVSSVRVSGIVMIVGMVVLFVLTVIYRDIVPSMFYLVTLVAGIALLAR
jgi:hypothetical protein